MCDNEFPFQKIIEGKKRNLNSRKYCLECSPWGQHNTKKLVATVPKQVNTKTCPRCGVEKKPEEFYKRRSGNGLSPYCKPCTNEQTLERQRKFKKQCVEHLGGSCEHRGYDRYYGCLEFHHKDPNEKDFSIAKAKLTSFNQKVKDELDKCMLLCANCHREEHGKINGSYTP